MCITQGHYLHHKMAYMEQFLLENIAPDQFTAEVSHVNANKNVSRLSEMPRPSRMAWLGGIMQTGPKKEEQVNSMINRMPHLLHHHQLSTTT